jgi:hypothetical protein
MPTLKINVTISGKWKLDWQKIKHVIRGAVWTGVTTGGIWLATHWPAPLTTDIRPPLETPVCRTLASTIPGASTVVPRQSAPLVTCTAAPGTSGQS